MKSSLEVIAWLIASLAVIGAMVYLVVNVSLWFALLIFCLPSYKSDKDEEASNV